MPLNFPNASIVSYSKESKYLGENFKYGYIKNITVEGFLYENLNGSGVSGNLQTISGILDSGNNESYQSIILSNGATNFDLGSGRILSFSFEEGNPVRLGAYSATIEVPETGGSIDNLDPDDPYYSGLSFLDGTQIGSLDLTRVNDISESFNFSAGENGQFNYSHDLSFAILDADSGISVTLARDLARKFYESDPSFGLINSQYSGYYKLGSGAKYFNESYDLINGQFNFSKSYSAISNYFYSGPSGAYNLNLAHEITVRENGKVEIIENGIVNSLDLNIENAMSGAKNEIYNNSIGRINQIYSGYNDSSQYIFSTGFLSESDDLRQIFQSPINVSYDFDLLSNSVRYKATFSNDQFYDVSGSSDSSFSISQNNGVFSSTQDIQYSFNIKTGIDLGAMQLVNDKVNELLDSYSIQQNLGSDFLSDQGFLSHSGYFVEVSRALNLENSNKLSFSLTINKENNQSLLNLPDGYKKLSIEFNDQYGQAIFTEKNFASTDGNQFIQDLPISNQSSRDVTITAILERKQDNPFSGDNLKSVYLTQGNLNHCQLSGINTLAGFFVDNNNYVFNGCYVSSLQYSFNKNFDLVYNMQGTYLTERSAADNTLL